MWGVIESPLIASKLTLSVGCRECFFAWETTGVGWDELLVFRGAHTDAGAMCLIAHSDSSFHSPPEKQAG